MEPLDQFSKPPYNFILAVGLEKFRQAQGESITGVPPPPPRFPIAGRAVPTFRPQDAIAHARDAGYQGTDRSIYDSINRLVGKGWLKDAGHGNYLLDKAYLDSVQWAGVLKRLGMLQGPEVETFWGGKFSPHQKSPEQGIPWPTRMHLAPDPTIAAATRQALLSDHQLETELKEAWTRAARALQDFVKRKRLPHVPSVDVVLRFNPPRDEDWLTLPTRPPSPPGEPEPAGAGPPEPPAP